MLALAGRIPAGGLRSAARPRLSSFRVPAWQWQLDGIAHLQALAEEFVITRGKQGRKVLSFC